MSRRRNANAITSEVTQIAANRTPAHTPPGNKKNTSAAAEEVVNAVNANL
jgi:hypothetical protein